MALSYAWKRGFECSSHVWNETYGLGRGRETQSCSGFQPPLCSTPVDPCYHPGTFVCAVCVSPASLCQLPRPAAPPTAPSPASASQTGCASTPLPPVPSQHSWWRSHSLADSVSQSSSAFDTSKRSPAFLRHPVRISPLLKFSVAPRSR